jgi:hypothetical protein
MNRSERLTDPMPDLSGERGIAAGVAAMSLVLRMGFARDAKGGDPTCDLSRPQRRLDLPSALIAPPASSVPSEPTARPEHASHARRRAQGDLDVRGVRKPGRAHAATRYS